MRKRRSEYLSEFVANQYPVEVLKKIIIAVLDIVENFIVELEEDKYLNTYTTNRYEERIGSFQLCVSSKVESMCIKNMSTELQKRNFIAKYGMALNSLNREEKQVFIYTFIKRENNLTILSDLKMHPDQLTVIRKSAIVRFSIKLGLEKFIPLFESNLQ